MMKLTPRLLRYILNCYPPYLMTGIRVDYISRDWKRTEVSMKLRWYNRNAVKTHFGGSLYAMVDPHLMLMLMQLLGDDYVVWDKSAKIDFVTPGKTTVYACMSIEDEILRHIVDTLAKEKRILPEFDVDIVDKAGKTVARVRKTLYVRKKRRWKGRRHGQGLGY